MKHKYTFLFLAFLILSSCMGRIYRNLPEGTYSSGDYYIDLGSNGKFVLENISNTIDPRNFSLEGSYTYSRDEIDQDNDSYGTITFTVGSIYMDGTEMRSIFLDEDGLSESSQVMPGDRLEGWWAYSENITWGGMMRIWFNWPGIPRGNNFYDGHNELFSGDP